VSFLRFIRVILLVLFFISMTDGIVTAKAKLIRVAVLREEDHFTMAVQGRYDIVDFNTGKKLDTRVYLQPVLVSLEDGKTKVGGDIYDAALLIVAPRH